MLTFYKSGVGAVTLRKTVSLVALGFGASVVAALLLGFGDRAVTIAQSAPTSTPTEKPIPNQPDVPSGTTSEAVVAEMLKLAGVSRDDVVYNLGSGDGRLVITAVKDYGARRGVGVDNNPELVRLSNENAQKAGVSDRAQFLQQDLLQADLREASVVTLDLPPQISLKLRSRLLSNLKPGTRLVSHASTMGDWKPDKTITVLGGSSSVPQKLYYWVVPANISGDWQGQVEYASGRSQRYTLRFEQQFQQVKGDAVADGKKYTIPNITLTGDRLTFSRTETIQGQQGIIQFNGRVEGETLKGTAGIKWGILARNFPIVAKRSTTLQGRVPQ